MTVDLISVLGNDLTVVNAARVSYGKHKDKLDDADIGLLRYLAKNRHGTPFEHVVFQFRVSTTIKVAREWLRHRVGSFNEISTRYVELEWKLYTPEKEDVRVQVGKPGAYVFETSDDELAEEYIAALEQKHYVDQLFYEKWLSCGIARELLSFELPMSIYTQFYWTVNFRSLTNFLSLRTASNALREIQQDAAVVERLVQTAVPHLYSVWQQTGRQSL